VLPVIVRRTPALEDYMSRFRGAAAALLSPGASKRYRERKCCNNGAGSPRGADKATLTQTERVHEHDVWNKTAEHPSADGRAQ